MKHRASLILMEQLVMVLVFALAAAICLSLFVKAEILSRELTRKEEAVILAQSAAELLKNTRDPELVRKRLDTGAFNLMIRTEMTDPGLREAEIQIFHEETELFRLKTGWQEVAP